MLFTDSSHINGMPSQAMVYGRVGQHDSLSNHLKYISIQFAQQFCNSFGDHTVHQT